MSYPTKKVIDLPDVTGPDEHWSAKRKNAKFVRRGRKIFLERTAWLSDTAYGGDGYSWRRGSTRVNPLDVPEAPEWAAFATDNDVVEYGLMDAKNHFPDIDDPELGAVAKRCADYDGDSISNRDFYTLEQAAIDRAIAAAKARRQKFREELFTKEQIAQLVKTDRK